MATTTLVTGRATVAPSRLTDCLSLTFGGHIAGVLLLAGRTLPFGWLSGVCLVTSVLVAALTIGYYRNWLRARQRITHEVLHHAIRRSQGRGSGR